MPSNRQTLAQQDVTIEWLLPAMGEPLFPSPVRGKAKMRLLSIVLACVLLALGGSSEVRSQSAPLRPDRPFQRWLPPPADGQSNVIDQLRLLEQLRGAMAAPSTGSPVPQLPMSQQPMPELTEDQLQQLDRAYKAWTEQSGGAQLPDFDSIPKEWIDQALADPEQLQQAQRLIQQYARQRKLPAPTSLPSLPSGLKIPGWKPPEDSASSSSLSQNSSTEGPPSAPSPSQGPQSRGSQSARSQNLRSQSQSSQAETAGPGETGSQDIGSQQRFNPTLGNRPRAHAGSSSSAQRDGSTPPTQLREIPSQSAGQSSTDPRSRGQGTDSKNADSQNADSSSTSAPARGARRADGRNADEQSANRASPDSRSADTSEPDPFSAESVKRALSGLPPEEPDTTASASPPTAGAQASRRAASSAGNELLQSAEQSSETDNPFLPRPANDAAKDALSRPTDAAQLKALRELVEKLKAVQSARNAQQLPSGSRPNNRQAARQPDRQANAAATNGSDRNDSQSRQAPAQRSNADTASRNTQASNRGSSAPAPGVSGAAIPRNTLAQSPGARAPRSSSDAISPDQRTADVGLGADERVNGRGVQPTNGEGNASRFDPEAIDTLPPEIASFIPSLLESAGVNRSDAELADAELADALNSAALRSAARSSATLRSDPWSADAQRSNDQRNRMESATSSSRRPGNPQLDSKANENGLASGESELQARVKRDVNQLGWRRALRKIIDDTFKEDSVAVQPSQVSMPQKSFVERKFSEVQRSVPRSLNISPTAVRKSVPDALSDSRITSAVADIWKAVATTSTSSATTSVSRSPSSSVSTEKQSWKSRFDRMENGVWLVLLGVAGVAVAVWIGRRRPVWFGSNGAVDTRWAKEVLADGIRTRADVIRAFHRFVAHSTEPVASWWTHRYAARRLVEADPQLSVAMSDLSSVYEQARYMPPEAELSAEQISRVCGALRQCVAHGDLAVNASL